MSIKHNLELSSMSYKELIELEKEIRKVKSDKEHDVTTKGDIASYYYSTLWPLIQERLHANDFNDQETDRSVYNKCKAALFTLCDYALENYGKRCSTRPNILYAPSANGYEIFKNAKEYEKLAHEICDLIVRYMTEKETN